MRGNWDTMEPFVHAPNQQQQQNIVQQQRHPLHSPTTPAWGIADRIVKEEPNEDKNNDSGVSPDHYTSNSVSPRSRRSTSTANCSLSPGSANSQDSNNMQCSTFDYSPQGMFKNCNSSPEYAGHHSMDGHQPTQPMDVCSTSKPSNEDADLGQEILQCPICAQTTQNRVKFTEHLTTHCPTNCDAAEFVKTVLNQLTSGPSQDESRSSPNQGERSEQELEEADEPGVRVPRLNSQGKVKTFRCKQCSFVAITKLEFWEHSRSHIKAEKLLTCPKCPFVTEYKHHLEYHLRNHFGSKPFKCEKCPYTCVNKSMLNSHLKSHSNVYQYRCSNCSYATKYCHSLKLHLRKYTHQPAVVLNVDGSPNPLPIIDVYGTRRGPKQKPVKPAEDGNPGTSGATTSAMQIPITPPQMVVAPQISPAAHHLPIHPLSGMNGVNTINAMTTVNPMGTMNPMSTMNPLNTVNTMTSVTAMNGLTGVVQTHPVITFPYNQLFTGFTLPRFPALEDNGVDNQLDPLKSATLMNYLKAIDGRRMSEDHPQDLVIRPFNGNTPSGSFSGLSINDVPQMNGTSMVPNLEQQDECMDSSAAPLDLSKHDAADNVQRPAANSPKATGTSRRKGKAVKLNRRMVEEDTDEEMQLQQQPQQPQQLQQQLRQQQPVEPEGSFQPSSASSPGSGEQNNGNGHSFNGVSNEFTCQYCEIAFGNEVMYTVHMGYHGYNDPYTCNMCGHQCTDKLTFFLHIARSKHA